MVKESLSGLMAESMMDNIKMEKNMAMANFHGRVVKNLKDIGKKGLCMDKVFIIKLINYLCKINGISDVERIKINDILFFFFSLLILVNKYIFSDFFIFLFFCYVNYYY
jgi:hypothetical protein